MSGVSKQTLVSPRIKLLAIIALVVFPILLAWLMYLYGGNLVTVNRTNNGELILPPKDFARLSVDSVAILDGKWALLIPGSIDCDRTCQQLLYYTRQVHIALGKDADRLQRIYISAAGDLNQEFEALLADEYPLLKVLYRDGNIIAEIFGADWKKIPKVYVVDPLGNIMMVYTADLLGKPMLKDLKHLLKVSNIG